MLNEYVLSGTNSYKSTPHTQKVSKVCPYFSPIIGSPFTEVFVRSDFRTSLISEHK